MPTHITRSRASAGILGIGTDQIITAALDSRRRMDPNRLDETLADLRAGACRSSPFRRPRAPRQSVHSIRSTKSPTFAGGTSVWLHVDAAHGGALAFSQRHRHLLAGIDQADSVVCDAHKMMFMPALCAMLFYRNREHRLATFRQEAPYLFDPTAPYLAEYDSGIVNLECTKRPAAFGLWGIWSLFGPQLFADMVDVTIDLAQKFYAMLRSGRRFRAAARTAVQYRRLPLRAAPSCRRAARTARRPAASPSSRRDRIRRILPGAKPLRRATRPAHHDDEPAHDGGRPARAIGLHPTFRAKSERIRSLNVGLKPRLTTGIMVGLPMPLAISPCRLWAEIDTSIESSYGRNTPRPRSSIGWQTKQRSAPPRRPAAGRAVWSRRGFSEPHSGRR